MKRGAIVFLVLILNIHVVFGASALSSAGLGLPLNFPSSASMGMGGISLAIPNSMNISRTNPATLFAINTTRFDLQYFYENNRFETSAGKAESVYSNFDGFSFAVPITQKFVFSLGISPLTRMDYALSLEESLGGESYTKTVEGKGGLNAASLAFSYHPHSMVSIGLKGDFLFGNMNENWKVDYDNSSFDVSKTDLSTLNWGTGITAGIVFIPTKKTIVGAIYQPQIELSTESEVLFYNGNNYNVLADESRKGNVTYPSSWGIGFTYLPKSNWLMGFEYKQTNWEDIRINGNELSNIQSAGQMGMGLEWLPSTNQYDNFLRRIAYRIGASYTPSYILDVSGNEITEQLITVGFGLPVSNLNSRIDLALSYGTRGSLDKNQLTENIFRIHAAVAGGEKWFIRTY